MLALSGFEPDWRHYGLGLKELSVSAALIPELKRAIAGWTLPEAEALAREALSLDTSTGVRELLLRAHQTGSAQGV